MKGGAPSGAPCSSAHQRPFEDDDRGGGAEEARPQHRERRLMKKRRWPISTVRASSSVSAEVPT